MNNWPTLTIAITRTEFMILTGLLLAYVVSFVATMYALYLVVRNGVRDGINESRLTDNWRTQVARATSETHDGDTPPIRAER